MASKGKNGKDAVPVERMSATDTLNLNPAFIARVKKEEQLQKSSMARHFQSDMRRMRDEQLLPDMQFISGSQHYPGHKLILKSRLQSDVCEEWYDTTSGELPTLAINSTTEEDIKKFLNNLYTSEDLSKDYIISKIEPQDLSTSLEQVCTNKMTTSEPSPTAMDREKPSIREEQDCLENGNLNENSACTPCLNSGQAGGVRDSGDDDAEHAAATFVAADNASAVKAYEAANGEIPTENDNVSQAVSLPSMTSDLAEAGSGPDDQAELPVCPTAAQEIEEKPNENDATCELPDESATDKTPSVPDLQDGGSEKSGGGEDEGSGGNGDMTQADGGFIPCSGLAAGLLRCYQSQEGIDCFLSVDGRHFGAHKCILAARCQYFEAMFAGPWSESGETTIELHGVKAQSVLYILQFLYGAMVEVPVPDITAIMQASDMFGVEGLKDWLAFLISRDFCHFFHKPCQDCTRMVPDVLALASQFNLTVLSDHARSWVATHFRRIWEMPAFGALPPDLLDECVTAVAKQMSVRNITQVILDAHYLARSLQQNHRADQVQIATVKVMDEAFAYCAEHFPQLVDSQHFLSWSKGGAWCLDVLEESFTMAVSLLQPAAACQTYTSLRRLLAQSETDDTATLFASEEVRRLLGKLVERCEWYFHRYIQLVTQCSDWALLPADLQQQILQKSSFVPVQAASTSRAQSRTALKSAKMLRENIVHTVSMLCDTTPSLFPSLSQIRKVLTMSPHSASTSSSYVLNPDGGRRLPGGSIRPPPGTRTGKAASGKTGTRVSASASRSVSAKTGGGEKRTEGSSGSASARRGAGERGTQSAAGPSSGKTDPTRPSSGKTDPTRPSSTNKWRGERGAETHARPGSSRPGNDEGKTGSSKPSTTRKPAGDRGTESNTRPSSSRKATGDKGTEGSARPISSKTGTRGAERESARSKTGAEQTETGNSKSSYGRRAGDRGTSGGSPPTQKGAMAARKPGTNTSSSPPASSTKPGSGRTGVERRMPGVAKTSASSSSRESSPRPSASTQRASQAAAKPSSASSSSTSRPSSGKTKTPSSTAARSSASPGRDGLAETKSSSALSSPASRPSSGRAERLVSNSARSSASSGRGSQVRPPSTQPGDGGGGRSVTKASRPQSGRAAPSASSCRLGGAVGEVRSNRPTSGRTDAGKVGSDRKPMSDRAVSGKPAPARTTQGGTSSKPVKQGAVYPSGGASSPSVSKTSMSKPVPKTSLSKSSMSKTMSNSSASQTSKSQTVSAKTASKQTDSQTSKPTTGSEPHKLQSGQGTDTTGVEAKSVDANSPQQSDTLQLEACAEEQAGAECDSQTREVPGETVPEETGEGTPEKVSVSPELTPTQQRDGEQQVAGIAEQAGAQSEDVTTEKLSVEIIPAKISDEGICGKESDDVTPEKALEESTPGTGNEVQGGEQSDELSGETLPENTLGERTPEKVSVPPELKSVEPKGSDYHGGGIEEQTGTQSEDFTTEKLSGEATPGKTSGEGMPGKASEERTPEKASGEEIPEKSSKEETPEKASGDGTPEETLEEETPEKASGDGTPEEALEEETPEKASGGGTPEEASVEETPEKTSGDRPPEEALEESPEENIKEETPEKASREETPEKASGDRTPEGALGEEAPEKSSAEETPEKSLTEETLEKASGHRTPEEALEEETPEKASQEETPEKASGDRTPEEALGEETPEKSSTEETPEKASGNRTPEEDLGEETPEKSSREETPEKASGDRIPEEASEEESPPKSSEPSGDTSAQQEDAEHIQADAEEHGDAQC